MAFEIRPINGDFVGEVLGVDPGLEVDDETFRARGCMVSAFDSGVPQSGDVSRPHEEPRAQIQTSSSP